MLHVGTRGEPGDGEDDLGAFVDRLAAAGADDATEQARRHIQEAIARSAAPPGVRRLAEALAASLTEPPVPRMAGADASTVAATLHLNAMLILQDFGTDAVARTVATLVEDGRRVLVTAASAEELTSIGVALRRDLADRTLDTLPDISPAELRELRKLLVGGAAAAKARVSQPLPDAAGVPHPAEVAALCQRANHAPPLAPAAAMVPVLLAGIDHVRREAVTSVARYVHRTLRAMPPRATRPWAWHLLGDLIYGRHRSAFDQLLEDTAQAVSGSERAESLPVVTTDPALPPDAPEILRGYAEFLFAGGGRPRNYLRALAQRREVQPVLRLIEVDGRQPETADEVRRAVEHLELTERLARVERGCDVVSIPNPRGRNELTELADGLVRVAAAARSVGALRHDVLFLSVDSPLAVPDVDTAGQVAAAVLAYAEHGPHTDAAGLLDRMATCLAVAGPTSAMTPEHEAAVRALRARDASAYANAVGALSAARRAAHDAQRVAALLGRLRSAAPRLAACWTTAPAAGLGFVCVRPMQALLTALPEPDSADVVIVLGAHRLGVERLLVAAAAPRLVAVVPPGELPDETPTALSVLQCAALPTIRERPSPMRKVVPIGPRSSPVAVGSSARRAGA